MLWLLVKRYAFDVKLLANAYRRGYGIVEAFITLKHGEERINIRDFFRMTIDLLAIFYRPYFTNMFEGKQYGSS